MNQSQPQLPTRQNSDRTKVIQQPYPPTGQGSGFDSEYNDETIILQRFFWSLVRYTWLITTFLVIGSLLGALIFIKQTPLYHSTALIEIKPKVVLDFRILTPASDNTDYEISMEKMHSSDLAQQVVFELDLANKADFIAPTPTFSLTHMFRKVIGSTVQETFDGMSFEKRTIMAVNRISMGLSITHKRNSSIISITYSHPESKYTKAVANQLAQSFINQSVKNKGETTSFARQLTSNIAKQLIEEQVRETEKKLLESENALADYTQREGITTTGSDYIRITDNIDDTYNKLTKAIQERLEAERIVQLINDGNISTLLEVIDSASIQATKRKASELRTVYNQKLLKLEPDNPEMTGLQTQINELEGKIRVEVDTIATSTKNNLDKANEKVHSLRSELSDLERRQSEFPKKNFQYSALKRVVGSLQNQHDNLISRLNEVAFDTELDSSKPSIIALAIEPISPNSPNPPKLSKYLLLGFIISGCFASGIVLIMEFFNNTFSEPDQLEQNLNITILGITPHTAQKRIMGELEDTNSSISEAYRTLRTSLKFAGTDGNSSILAVTSSEPLEGKSLTCLKLARDFASLGKKVLLVDCNMRKPKLHHFLQSQNTIGLSNLLTAENKKKMIEAYQTTSTANLTFISSGTIPSNPSDILMSNKMEPLLQDFKKHYDLIILDCPPVIGLSDAPLISHQADFTLLVVAARHAPRKSIANAMKRLTEAGANVIGAVFTKFQANKFDYDYAYRYLKNNYYSNGAEDEPNSSHVDN